LEEVDLSLGIDRHEIRKGRMNRILITGAAGKSQHLARGLRGRYALLRLSTSRRSIRHRRRRDRACRSCGSRAVEAAMRGIDCVVHLGAIPGEDTWDKILPNNVSEPGMCSRRAATRRASRHLCELASRVGFIGANASSTRRRSAPDRCLRGEQGVRRGGRTPVRRQARLSVACLRIGAFRDKPTDRRLLHVWLSPRDAVQLVGCCIDAPDYHFIVVYGVSNNTRNRYRNAGVEFLGHRPQDNSRLCGDILRTRTPRMRSRWIPRGPYTQMGSTATSRGRVGVIRSPCAIRTEMRRPATERHAVISPRVYKRHRDDRHVSHFFPDCLQQDLNPTLRNAPVMKTIRLLRSSDGQRSSQAGA